MDWGNIHSSWEHFFNEESNKEYFIKLNNIIDDEYSKYVCYPAKENIFKAFEYDLNEVKVVILSQDPYHDGSANGLAFSTNSGKFPASLRNIANELKSEYDKDCLLISDLTHWAEQGVLLLNTALTVREHEPNSHSKIGWSLFTDNVVKYINNIEQPIVFMLWGRKAQEKKVLLNNSKHIILESGHPSPLSVKKFYGNNHFLKANEFLSSNGLKEIDWCIPE